MADVIDRRYHQHVETPSDINEHLPTLRQYAGACPQGLVAEMGVRCAMSTWALLRGLLDRHQQADAPQMWSIDIEDCPNVLEAQQAAARAGITHHFVKHDSATYTLARPVDLLFIDTWHVYAHLRRELAQHAANVRCWIVLHDTEGDRDEGESVRMRMDVAEQSRSTGYPPEEIRTGLRRAVLEFLLANDEWDVLRHFRNNNGLTVLGRRGTDQTTRGSSR